MVQFYLLLEYDNFKDLWDIIPMDKQKLNLLIEKLCSIELREMKTDKAMSDNAALITYKNGKKKFYRETQQ